MTLSDIMTPEQIQATRQVAQIYNVPADLLAAIGWHETQWGRLGAGRQGWFLGYGYYPGSTVAEQYRGLLPQLQGAASQIANFFRGRELTYENWLAFARQSWRPGNPDSWAKSTWTIYQQLQGKQGVAVGPGPSDTAGGTGNKTTGPIINPVVLAGGAVILALVLAAGVALVVAGGVRGA